MSSFPKFFLLPLAFFLLLGSPTVFAQGPGTKLKAPIRVNLNRNAAEGKEVKTLAGRLRGEDQLRLPGTREGGEAFLDKELMPNFTQGDIVDEDPLDEMKEEDFLNPAFLKPLDAAGDLRNEQIESLRGELELEGEDKASPADEIMEEERRQLFRELVGQEDPFKFLETKGTLVEPKRGGLDKDALASPGENVDRNNRASLNLTARGVEKGDAQFESASTLGKPANAQGEGSRFANAHRSSLIDSLIGSNNDRLNLLDSINQKYGLGPQNRSSVPEAASRIRRSFVEDGGGVQWRGDLRVPERDRRSLDSLAPSRERGSRLGYGSVAAGDAPSLGRGFGAGLAGVSGGAAGNPGGIASLRIGGGLSGRSRNSRADSLLEPKARRPSRGFNLGGGLSSGFDAGPLKNPAKF